MKETKESGVVTGSADVRPIIVLMPRLWAYAKRRGYLKNKSYRWVKAKRLPE